MKEESCEKKQKEMDTRQANTTDVHGGGDIPIVIFMIILEKNGWKIELGMRILRGDVRAVLKLGKSEESFWRRGD